MRSRIYFINSKKLSEITGVPDDTIRDMCQRGELIGIKFGKFVLLPTIQFRLRYKELPIEFWQEITEDLYRELDGPSSAEMRLERRKNGRNPSTGEKLDPQKSKTP